MKIRYLFSASKGDIPLEPEELALPFKITPTQEHPFLTLKDYFDATGQFILMDGGKGLLRLMEEEQEGYPIIEKHLEKHAQGLCVRLFKGFV